MIEDPISLVKKEPRFWAKKIIFTNLPEIFGNLEKRYYPDHGTILKIIRQAGGISIIAHPLLEYKNFGRPKKNTYRRFLNHLITKGIEGFEIYYYTGQGFSYAEQQKYNRIAGKLARENHLIVTYGSDCHGPKRKDPSRIFLGKFGAHQPVKFI